MSEPAVYVEGLRKSFGDVEALKGVDFEIAAGSIFGLLGPNGAGKTTAVRILTTLLRPDGGIARVAGYDVVEDEAILRTQIGLAGQSAAIDGNLTGLENLRMVGQLYHLPRAEARRRATEVIERLGLADAGDRVARTYSGGMRRRLDLASSLIARPSILFLDEPTTGLDPRSRLGMWAVIEGLVAEGTTVLLTTQYLEEADQLAQDIVVIDHGRVIAHGTAEALKDQIGGDRIEVTVVNLGQAGAAADVLRTVSAGEPAIEEGRVSAPVAGGSTVLVSAIRALDVAGIEVSDLLLRRPTLDDVFMSLTGHAAEEEPPVAAKRGRKGRQS